MHNLATDLVIHACMNKISVKSVCIIIGIYFFPWNPHSILF